ncbi:bifunctional riboflavin kinase/FAD synthetase [Chengkuizengella axinellae]|uniref:Riboflavin biosynthesis protein n=1 Tax=Chengkuizengella axinellae TaxID=3064388 RepID=A0ABT9IVX2_9BACL|nr:bifunctional riboflavin kinase/FAD synthetase [Chengkuizengella sp. 2205SS18-9]MDP5273487.1 bifunctional riboflavin kinase/FAD synthetase [Chengkuizengella sp. 2205SS18-9]
MKIIHLSYPLQFPIRNLPDSKQVLAIGDFDGIHLGHQHVIHKAKNIAMQHNLPLSIMTFNPHPREVLGQSKYSRYLVPLQKKMELLEGLDLDYVYIVHFDKAFSKVSTNDFVNKFLYPLQLHTIVVGFDFTFGHRGSGTVETLKQLCDQTINVNIVEPYNLNGEKVSSTLIREQLHLGNVDLIKQFTGRDYFITGTVVHGDGRGRTIGFPTANIEVSEPFVLPKKGVYVVKITLNDKLYTGVINIGVKPTFYEENITPTLEVHILNYNGDIYDEEIKVEFLTFIRDEKKFQSVDDLVAQIKEDVKSAQSITQKSEQKS